MMVGRDDRTERRRAHLLAALTREGALSRAELAARTGLPSSTVIDLAAQLLLEGLVEEIDGPRPARPGRPAMLLRLHPATGYVGFLGINRGGLQAAVIAGDGTVQAKAARLLDYTQPDGGIALLAELLDKSISGAGLTRQNLGRRVLSVPAPVHNGRPTTLRAETPGLASYKSGRIRWIGLDPGGELQGLVGAPVVVENDANLSALGEAVYGVARSFSIVAYVMLAGGLGGGVVLDKRLLRGATGLTGEFGHIHVDDDGPLCVCGAQGCLGLQGNLHETLRRMEPAFDQELTVDRLSDLCASDHRPTQRLLYDLGAAIGSAIGAACVVLNPDAIVVDGTLKDAVKPVIDGIRHGIERHAPSVAADNLAILPGALHDNAGIYGALALSSESP
jgi:predicted NBD/HSP70 family sugar kinase